MSVTVDRVEWDIEEIVQTEILPFISLQDVAAGLAIGGVLAKVSISPLFSRRKETLQDERQRLRDIDDEEEYDGR